MRFTSIKYCVNQGSIRFLIQNFSKLFHKTIISFSRDLKKKGGTKLFNDMQVKLNFNQHKKNFTCEALVVVALKKKLKTFNHFFKTFSKNYSNSVKTLLILIINNTIYK